MVLLLLVVDYISQSEQQIQFEPPIQAAGKALDEKRVGLLYWQGRQHVCTEPVIGAMGLDIIYLKLFVISPFSISIVI